MKRYEGVCEESPSGRYVRHDEAQAAIDELVGVLRDIDAEGYSDVDERLRYVSVQLDRETHARMRDLIAKHGKDREDA
jgi:hypothetical protein